MPSFRKYLGNWGLVKLMFSLIPDGAMLLRGIPKLILLIEFNGQTQQEVDDKIDAMKDDLRGYHMAMEKDDTVGKSQKFWIMRRQSFNLLRSKVKDKHTAPFIDDLVVNPEHLTEFLPKIRKIIKKYNLLATIAGHMGDGNFHIIPLMKIEEKSERAKLLPAMKEVDELVLKYKGSLSGEHNDGLVRGPWLEQQFGKEVLKIFKQTKHIFDPENIFNPHKKSDADWDYSFSHIRQKF
jgi:FAD/FMN-containing dehydrogenase